MPVRRENGKYYVVGERKHWKDMLNQAEVDFIEHILKGNGKELPYDQSQLWHEIHERIDAEGWTGWRLVNGEVKGLSLVPIDREHEELVIDWDDYKKKKPGPLAPLLDEFVHEDEAWQS
jgi:hypothetical protein